VIAVEVNSAQPASQVMVITSRSDGTVIDKTTTGPDGCAVLASEPGANATIELPDAITLLTTPALSEGVLEVYGAPTSAYPRPPDCAIGHLHVDQDPPPRVKFPPPATISAHVLLGTTASEWAFFGDGGLPIDVAVPSRMVGPAGQLDVTLGIDVTTTITDPRGYPETVTQRFAYSRTVMLDHGDASYLSTAQDPADGSCATDWPVTLDAGLGSAPFMWGELEAHGVSRPTVRCLPAKPLGLDVPPGVSADIDHVTIALFDAWNGTQQQITTIRSSDPVTVTQDDFLPLVFPSQPLFQDPSHHALQWPATDLDVDATVVAVEVTDTAYGGGAWYVAMPPSAGHITLPSDPDLPQGLNRGVVFYVDSSDLAGFDALVSAGIHVDRNGPLTTGCNDGCPDQFTRASYFSTIAPRSSGRLRITATGELF
jgi:hypothetical protein